jgi:hypothetical protein
MYFTLTKAVTCCHFLLQSKPAQRCRQLRSLPTALAGLALRTAQPTSPAALAQLSTTVAGRPVLPMQRELATLQRAMTRTPGQLLAVVQVSACAERSKVEKAG